MSLLQQSDADISLAATRSPAVKMRYFEFTLLTNGAVPWHQPLLFGPIFLPADCSPHLVICRHSLRNKEKSALCEDHVRLSVCHLASAIKWPDFHEIRFMGSLQKDFLQELVS